MLEELRAALDAYQHFDPVGWVALFRFLPPVAGVALSILGAGMLLFGGGRLFRLIAGPLGAAAGLLWMPAVATRLGLGDHAGQIRIAAAVGLGAVGFMVPAVATFFAFGLPIGMVAGSMAGNDDWALGFVPAFIVGGVLALAAQRYVGAVASSLVGGWLLIIGLLAALKPVTPLVESVVVEPWGLLIAGLLFATAGTVYQLFVRLTPEARATFLAYRAVAKQRRAEARKVEERFKNYSKDKGLD